MNTQNQTVDTLISHQLFHKVAENISLITWTAVSSGFNSRYEDSRDFLDVVRNCAVEFERKYAGYDFNAPEAEYYVEALDDYTVYYFNR